MIKPDEFKLQDYINSTFNCSCNRVHKTNLKEVDISAGALKNIPALVKKYGYRKPFLLSDSNTYEVAGEKIEALLKNSGIDFVSYILKYPELVPNEAVLGEVMTGFDRACDLIIAVGTGTLNDLCKFFSYQMNLDYFIVATAPSMDGFASDGAALIVKNLKVTYPAHVPTAIIADIDIIKNAPIEMITAGVGDILGKYTCLCDWKMASIINREYSCDVVVEMVRKSIDAIVSSIQTVQSRDPETVAKIMEGLILTGIAMSFVGNSRPASGSEHHLSHYWEMMFLFQGKKAVLHGAKVGVGTIAVLKAYEILKGKQIDFDKAREKAKTFRYRDWEQNIIRTYGAAAKGVIELEMSAGKNDAVQVSKRIDLIEKNWDEMVAYMNEALPSPDEIASMLKALNAPVTPSQVGIDGQTLVDSIIVAKEVRNRYGLLQMMHDLGVAEEISLGVKEYFLP